MTDFRQRELFDRLADFNGKPPDDVCARKHGGNPESVAAFEAVRDHAKIMRRAILKLIVAAGWSGHTLDEVSVLLGKHPNALSGRVTDLRKSGDIVLTPRRRATRSGCSARVYVAKEFS